MEVDAMTTEACTDRISQLPVPIITEILSFLPTKEVVAMSVLSKQWLCYTLIYFPISDFSDIWFGLGTGPRHDPAEHVKRQQFFNFVDNSLHRQCELYNTIHRFRLSMTDFSHPQFISCLDHWLGLVREYDVKELDLHLRIDSEYYHPYSLPETLSCFSTLTVLRLRSCILKLPIYLPSLLEFSLSNCFVNDNMIEDLNFTCPMIQKFALLYCQGLKRLHLFGLPHLKKVKMINTGTFDDNKIFSLHIALLGLKSFSFGGKLQNYDVDINGCENLEVLKLKYFKAKKEQQINDIISQVPFLKVLALDDGWFTKKNNNIVISCQRLEKLKLTSSNLEQVLINSPRLRSFKYANRSSTSFPPLFLLQSSCLQKVSLKPYSYQDFDFNCLLAMKEYLENFNHIELLKLHFVCPSITFVIPERFKMVSPPLSNIQYLKLKIASFSSASGCYIEQAIAKNCCEALVDGLFWMCKPKSLLLESGWGSNNEFMEILCKNLMHWLASARTKSWQRDLKGTWIVRVNGYGDRMALSCVTLLKSLPTLPPDQKIFFMFEW